MWDYTVEVLYQCMGSDEFNVKAMTLKEAVSRVRKMAEEYNVDVIRAVKAIKTTKTPARQCRNKYDSYRWTVYSMSDIDLEPVVVTDHFYGTPSECEDYMAYELNRDIQTGYGDEDPHYFAERRH